MNKIIGLVVSWENKIFSLTKTWSLTKKVGAIACCWLALFVAIYYSIIAENNHKFILLKKEQHELSATLKQQRILIAKLLTQRGSYSKLQTQYKKYNQMLNNKINMASLLRYLTECAQNQEVVLSSIVPGTKTKQDWLVSYPLQISAAGSFHQLANFMTAVSNGKYLLVMNDFKLTADKNNQLILQTLFAILQNNNANTH